MNYHIMSTKKVLSIDSQPYELAPMNHMDTIQTPLCDKDQPTILGIRIA